MNALHSIVWSCISPQMLRSVLTLAMALLAMGPYSASDDAVCKTSDIEQSVFAAFAEYHTTLGADSVGKAVQDVESLIESLRAIVSGCGDGTESDVTDANMVDVGSDDGDDEIHTIESEGAGAGTVADPIKADWTISDGEGRWIGVYGYAALGSEICTASGGYCKDIKPGNEFIAVAVYGKCDTARRTRCKFSRYSEFELAGRRGIPYRPEGTSVFEDYWTVFSEDILPGGESAGLVFFQAPKDESGLIFGWTPSFSADTIWYAMTEIEFD